MKWAWRVVKDGALLGEGKCTTNGAAYVSAIRSMRDGMNAPVEGSFTVSIVKERSKPDLLVIDGVADVTPEQIQYSIDRASKQD